MSIDLDDLRVAADEAAKQTGKALALFQLVAAYVALSLLQLSDVDYLIGLGQSMPIIGGTVPTKLFLAIAPGLLFILHVAVLLHWATFRRRLRHLLEEVGDGPRVAVTKTTGLLYPFALTEALLPEQHGRRARWSAMALAFVALVFVPLGLLVWIHVRSLCFHDSSLTILHRSIVVLDLGAMWVYLPLYSRGPTLGRFLAPLAVSATLIYFIVWDAAIPGNDVVTLPQIGNWTDQIRLRRLDLRGATLQLRATSEDKAAKTPLLDLRGRDLRHADLSFASFVRTALDGADFTGAQLLSTRFAESTFAPLSVIERQGEPATKRATAFAFTKAPEADFTGQDLREVDFTGAVGTHAKFVGANLTGAKLTGAAFDFSDFKAADLRRAKFTIASLLGADFRHALLSQADLRGADLRGSIWFRNPVAFTRLHLADMTYSRVQSLDQTDAIQVRSALAVAYASPHESELAWNGLLEQSSIGTDTSRGRGFYGLRRELAWGMRHDYLPIPSGIIDPPPSEPYLVLLRALIGSEIDKNPRLAQAIEARLALEPLFIRMIYTQDTLPHISLPHVMNVKELRRLWLDPRTVIEAVVSKKRPKVLDENRYSPWDKNFAANRSSAAPPWTKEFLSTIAELNNDEAIRKLSNALINAAKSGDSVALALLPHIVPYPVKAPYQPMVDWLAAEVVTRNAAPETRVALSSLLEEGSPRWSAALATSKTSSPDIDWILGRSTKDEALMMRAADADHVIAGGSIGSWRLVEKNVAPGKLGDNWDWMGRAAYRGITAVQWAVGVGMHRQGDFESAIRWYTEAMNDGRVKHINSLAWLLATCPEARHRDASKAMSLARRAQRDVESELKDAKDDPDNLRGHVLDTLAAAYAATGDFGQAIQVQTEAVATIRPRDGVAARKLFQKRLDSYRAKRAWIDYTDSRSP